MTEETEEAFDLFSTSYVRVPKVTEAEKREAEEKRIRAAIAAYSKAIEDTLLHGSHHSVMVFQGLGPVIEWKEIPYKKLYIEYEYREPNLGASPAAKPAQPRHWVAMNQAPKRARR